MTVRHWCEETDRLLEQTEVAFELALHGLPEGVPVTSGEQVGVGCIDASTENAEHLEILTK